MSNPIEAIHVIHVSTAIDGHRVWVIVGRCNPRRYSASWSRMYSAVTPSSLRRAQRAQLKLAGIRVELTGGKTCSTGALAGHRGGK